MRVAFVARTIIRRCQIQDGQQAVTRHAGRKIPVRTARSIAVILGLALVGGAVTPAWAHPVNSASNPVAATHARAGELPAPFSDWNVTVRPDPDTGEGALTVSYESPLLGHRTDNTVFLPTSYGADGPPLPVLYYLHGTVFPQSDDPALDPATQAESLVSMASSGGGYKQTLLQDFPSQRHKAKFVVVAPDTNPTNSWCETCLWIDGIDDLFPELSPATAKTLPAESVIYRELIPLVEALFNVRTDRGGRGVTGFSMGGAAAFLPGFRHPDMYSYVAPISGGYDLVDDEELRTWIDLAGYLRDQGYGNPETHAVMWENFSPSKIYSNFAGSGGHLMVSAGDICMPPTDGKGVRDCANRPPLTNPFAAATERMLRNNNDRSIEDLAKAGIPSQQVRFSGVHGANNHRVYSDIIVPGANRVFARAPKLRERFFYRTADGLFDVWGYDVSVRRDNPDFLSIENARHDSRAFSLRGTGTVTVATPTVFQAGRWHRVTLSTTEQAVDSFRVKSDRDGRLRLKVDLDDSRFHQGAQPLNVSGSDPGSLVRVRIVSS